MTRPIPAQAEGALEYPDKLSLGTFERTARFDAHLDEAGISLSLHRSGSPEVRKSVRIHFHYALFADILLDLARTAASIPPDDVVHREAVRDAAKALYLSLEGSESNAKPHCDERAARKVGRSQAQDAQMTPEEEVLLLHVLE
jgi:hypothetical protein